MAPQPVKDPKTFPLVVFNSTITGNFRYLDVTINDNPVPLTTTGIAYQQNIDNKALKAIYRFSGGAGDFSVFFSCTVDGVSKSIEKGGQGIQGKIGSEGHYELVVEVPLD